MTLPQLMVIVVMTVTIGLFVFSQLRHDIVALIALLAAVILGLVPSAQAFNGFSQPAVITVACVLVLTRMLQLAGAVEAISRFVLPARAGRTLSMLALVGLGAVLSSFMNNVGALALLMPVALRLARRLDMAAGQILMPLSFGTILGGMTTLIGTPPNLIVSGIRADAGLGDYRMFDFTPVGLPVAVAGVALLVTIGWRLVPARDGAGANDISTGVYLTEARLGANSPLLGQTLAEAETRIAADGGQVVGLVRNDVRLFAPRTSRQLVESDILIVEAELDVVPKMLKDLGLVLAETLDGRQDEAESAEKSEKPARTEGGARGPDNATAAAAAQHSDPSPGRLSAADRSVLEQLSENPAGMAPAAADTAATSPTAPAAAQSQGASAGKSDSDDRPHPYDVILREVVVMPGAALTGRSPASMEIRSSFGINVLALSRSGQRQISRLSGARFRSGDLLLLQGDEHAIARFCSEQGCMPLGVREIDLPRARDTRLALAIMGGAVIAAVAGLLPTAIAFTLAVTLAVIVGVMPLRQLYNSIDWSVVVLLGALFPLAAAIETTGTAGLVANWIVHSLAAGNVVIALTVVLVLTMFLSDVMNNAATAAVMAPIGMQMANSLNASPDQFLMAVAIGASCAFLTPIGHQNNTLILGPGGFRFGDYWKSGALLELLIVPVSIPLLLMFW